MDAFEEFFDFSRYSGLPDEAALGDLSGIDPSCLYLPTTHEQFAFGEDVSPALRDGSGSTLQSFSSPGDSLSASPPTLSSSDTVYYNQVDHSLPLVVTSYKCLYAQCSERFKSIDACRKHSATKHPEKPYNCGLLGCDKSFPDERSLRRHMATTRKHRTSNTPAYTCHCSASQPRWDKFKEHLRGCRLNKTASSKFSCVCGQVFQETSGLEAHKAAYHPDKRGRPRKVRETSGKENR